MKKKNLPITNIGTVTLLMVFIVLCMITLAALSLSTSSRDARLEQKAAQRMTEYYTASNKAEELLAAADDIFSNAYEQASDPANYYRLIYDELILTDLEPVLANENLTVSFQVELNTSQALFVSLDVLPLHQLEETAGNSFYKILSWQVIRTDIWEGDDSLQLIQ